jgi:hypothetical protein
VRWPPWKRTEEAESRDAVRQVIETHRRAAMDVIGLASKGHTPPEGMKHG